MFVFLLLVVSVHALEMKLPFGLQFPTQEDTRPGHADNNEWARMQDSLYLPPQSLMDNSLGGKFLFTLLLNSY